MLDFAVDRTEARKVPTQQEELDRLAEMAACMQSTKGALLIDASRSPPEVLGIYGIEPSAVAAVIDACADCLAQPTMEAWLPPTPAAVHPYRYGHWLPLPANGGAASAALLLLDESPRAQPAPGTPALQMLARHASDVLALARRCEHAEQYNASVLRESESRLNLTEHTAGAGSWSLQLSTHEVIHSDEFATVMGLGDHHRVKNLEDMVQRYTPEWRNGIRQRLERCAQNGEGFDEEIQITVEGGPAKWVRTVGTAVRRANGEIARIQGAIQDISAQKQAQQDTLRLAMRLTTTLASITEAFVTLDRDGQFMYANTESEALLGHTMGELLGEPVWKWLPGRHPSLLEDSLRDALARNERVEFEDFYPRLGKWLEVRAYPYAEGLAVYFRDVSQRRAEQEQLTLLRTGIAHLNDVVVIVEPMADSADDVRIAFVNEAFERLSGFTRAQIVGQSLGTFHRHDTHAPLQELLCHLPRHGDRSHSRRELPFRRADGSTLWVDLDVVPVHDRDGGLTHWVAVGRDVSERKAADEKIHHLAFFDALTELPNRQLLIERLQSALDESARSRQYGALMFIDLDNFKVLNDTMGHHKGDLLLQRVAERLRRSVRKSDTVARLGGDEFVVMLQHLGTEVETAARKAQVVAEKVLARMVEPFDLGGSQHFSTTSIGVTPFGGAHTGAAEVSDLLTQADLAMYQAKGMGRNTVAFFDPEMQAAISASASMSADLRAALHAHGQIGVHYQPQFDLAQRVVGAEALARWQHPERGSVSPSEFIPIAEDTGLILPLGTWVMEESCRQLAAWGENPDTALLSISVNVSVRQFRHPEFVDLVMGVLARHGVQPHLLKLELTESLLADRMEITLAKMGKLKQLGVTLSLDDFGTGYSSLAYLKLLPIDQLKIDKAFVADVLSDPSDAAIAHAIIGLAHSVGLTVIAEGVENEAQRHWLAERGCDLFQGFLLAQPMPVDEVNAFLKTHTAQRALQLA